MSSADGHALLAAMANGRLATTIAEEATGGSATMDDVLDRALATCLTFKYCRQQPQMEEAAHIDDGNSSDEEEMDMLALRKQAKEVSRAAVANGCLPAYAIRQSRQKSPFASMALWQDAIEVLQGIVSSPTQPELLAEKPSQKCLEDAAPATSPQVLDEWAMTPTVCTPTRPTSARTSKSRPSSRAASRTSETSKARPSSRAAMRSSEATPTPVVSVVSPKFSALRGLPPRPVSAARLPPVKSPSRVLPAEPHPATSALEMDLGFGHMGLGHGRVHATPEKKQRASAMGNLQGTMASSKSATKMSLPSLPGVAVVTDTRFGSKSLSKLSMRPMATPQWGISSDIHSMKWGDQSLIC